MGPKEREIQRRLGGNPLRLSLINRHILPLPTLPYQCMMSSMQPVINRFNLTAVLFQFIIILGIATQANGAEPSSLTSQRTITVSGSAIAQAAPNLVTVRFGVEIQQKTARPALSGNAETMQKVVDALRHAGIGENEISTSRFNIQAVYDSQQDLGTGRRTQILAGYRVSNIIQVETYKLDLVAAMIDTAVGAGVNRVEDVSFSLSPAVRAELREGLIEQAVLNARSKAEKALAPLNYVILGVQKMSLTDFLSPLPGYADSRRVEMAMSVPTQIFAVGQNLRSTVNVTFLIGEANQQ